MSHIFSNVSDCSLPSMELETPDGSTIPVTTASDTVIGRALGLRRPSSAGDRTVSRCHLALRLLPSSSSVSFQVIGKNPILISSSSSSSSSVPNRIYRRSESGELLPGNRISLSLTHPSFFFLKSTTAVDERVLDAVERRERRTLERQKDKERDDKIELAELDVSQIDAVEEFGFLVKGREFEKYGGRRVRHARDWDWFLEETKRGDDDGEEEEGWKVKGRRRKKKKGGEEEEEEEEEWAGESGVGFGDVGSKRPRYTTRSRHPKKLHKETSKSLSEKGGETGKCEFEEEDEADGTLGGFIIDAEATEEEEDEEEGEEEEELEDDDMSDED